MHTVVRQYIRDEAGTPAKPHFLILNALRASVPMIFLVLKWFLMVLTNLTAPTTKEDYVFSVFF